MSSLGRAIINYMNKMGKKLTKDQLRRKLGISGEEEVNFFNEEIDELECNGYLYQDEKGFYHTIDDNIYSCGKISISKRGSGYVTVIDDNVKTKYIVQNEDLNGALNNDFVMIIPTGNRHYGRKTARVEKILKRASISEIYKYIGNGIFEIYGINTNVNFQLDTKKCSNLVEGTLVIASVGSKIIHNIDGKLYFDGVLSKIVGHQDDPKNQIKAVGLKYGFDNEFSDKINKIVAKLPTTVTEKEKEDRRDLTQELTFTIDGIDTKDIDDAVSIQKVKDGYILKVSIADVSHFVKNNTILIEEAIKRGNSAYLADSVFPMFPHIMSNGICSLNPNQERLAKTVEMFFDNEGNLLSSSIYKSVIKSKKKMNYDDVNKIFDGNKIKDYEIFEESLRHMRKLSKLISQKRKEKGSLDFDSRELKIKTDKYGNPIDIKERHQGEAEKIIENFMIAANIEVTQHFGYLDYPFIYRVHPSPNSKDLKTILEVLKEQDLGNRKSIENVLKIIEKGKDVKPSQLLPILTTISNDSEYSAVSNVLLRVMKKAEYSKVNIGHFGLSENDYSHFTSPIRRCADLINHIIIDYIIDLNYAKSAEETKEILENISDIESKLSSICDHISEREKAADDAETEIDQLKQIQFVQRNIEDFEGPLIASINYINRYGLKLIVNNLIEAKIDLTDLTEKGYVYKSESHTFVNQKQKKKLKFGDIIFVFDPEVLDDVKLILYHSFGKTPDELLEKNSSRVYKKSFRNEK
ncbi:MAG: VacB/RNase II family 3'-5' exoribonuclease [Bacilli bacterium]|nr:VacB/RNase II family 3'-5' exoribonuclease [Bacilli bacterium]